MSQLMLIINPGSTSTKVALFNGNPAIGIGFAVGSSSEKFEKVWMKKLCKDLFATFNQAKLPKPSPRTACIQNLAKIQAALPEMLLSVEFHSGYIIAKKPAE